MISSCARRLTSISCSTDAVRPPWPTLANGAQVMRLGAQGAPFRRVIECVIGHMITEGPYRRPSAMALQSTKKNKFGKAWMHEHVNDP